MSQFTVTDLPLQGLKLIENKSVGDSRGYISRLFCSEELADIGWCSSVAQVNHTLTLGIGTIRGMHLQKKPYAEMKLVHCIRGEIWDVAVDVRAKSPTFLHWHAEYLSGDNKRSLLIPQGFAHGFQTLTESVELLYLHTAKYSKSFEVGFNPKDPKLNISWPLPISKLSSRDENHSLIDINFDGIIF
jgi:dTDP-4-dehydrorhamnose 3,5-epimerase